MTKRLIVVRAQPGAQATAALIAAAGGEAVLCPLFHIVPVAAAVPECGPISAVLFTSAHGVRAAPFVSRTLPVLAVGDSTAAAARAAGFTTVQSADGDGAALARLGVSVLAGRPGTAVHFRGEDQAGDVVGALRASGIAAIECVVYRAAQVDAVAPAVLAACAKADGVLLHSPRGGLAVAALMAPLLPQLTAYCISAATQKAVQAAGFLGYVVAERPTEAALLQAAFAQTDAQG